MNEWWNSRKLWYAAAAVVAVLAIVLAGSALGISDEARTQAIDAIKWLGTALLAGHAVTDAAGRVRPPSPPSDEYDL